MRWQHVFNKSSGTQGWLDGVVNTQTTYPSSKHGNNCKSCYQHSSVIDWLILTIEACIKTARTHVLYLRISSSFSPPTNPRAISLKLSLTLPAAGSTKGLFTQRICVFSTEVPGGYSPSCSTCSKNTLFTSNNVSKRLTDRVVSLTYDPSSAFW